MWFDIKLFQKAANYLYKKFTTNQLFKELVQPTNNNDLNHHDNSLKNTRGNSIVLRQHTFNAETQKSKKSSCCN
jgi:hypothetical protein